MKYMNKGRIIKKNAVDNVLQEAEMMNKMNHPFIVNLWFSFQDEEDLFLVVDLLLGGDLSWHLEQENRMEVDRVLLYVAEVALALEYLKRKKIIHRFAHSFNLFKPQVEFIFNKKVCHFPFLSYSCIFSSNNYIGNFHKFYLSYSFSYWPPRSMYVCML